ncbi:hypothetical protein UCRNP2_7088 [Neofusicoccum parvum UCRNP2]|uniref:Uncharacterized protein n=1 Tax=Botryosphaeria parva (strain UCR-NP2) TaxID=1287680 RepID=R1EEK6_BOTPV|nr:hypothetical protein UCRNP2_7088 [Neofusicoccum parvum UCRNP2]
MDLPALQFNRLRLSGSPASSPRVVDAPVSPTKSVYLDVDETTPTSPRLRSPYGTKTAAAIRRTNFFDDDSSSDEDVDDEEEEELETADEHPFSQRQSFVEEDEGRGKARSSPRSRSLHTATTNTTTNGLRVEGSTRKGAYYLGVRPEELSDAFEESNDGAVVETHSLQNKTDDNVLAVHAITLQALLRDEEGLQASASSVEQE